MFRKFWAVLARFSGEAPKSVAEEKFQRDETYESELAKERARQARERMNQPAQPEQQEEVTIEVPEGGQEGVELDKAA